MATDTMNTYMEPADNGYSPWEIEEGIRQLKAFVDKESPTPLELSGGRGYVVRDTGRAALLGSTAEGLGREIHTGWGMPVRQLPTRLGSMSVRSTGLGRRRRP